MTLSQWWSDLISKNQHLARGVQVLEDEVEEYRKVAGVVFKRGNGDVGRSTRSTSTISSSAKTTTTTVYWVLEQETSLGPKTLRNGMNMRCWVVVMVLIIVMVITIMDKTIMWIKMVAVIITIRITIIPDSIWNDHSSPLRMIVLVFQYSKLLVNPSSASSFVQQCISSS